jgi:hypothetical protein
MMLGSHGTEICSEHKDVQNNIQSLQSTMAYSQLCMSESDIVPLLPMFWGKVPYTDVVSVSCCCLLLL